MSLKDLPEYNGIMKTVNYLRWHGYKYGIFTPKDMYDRLHDIREPPKCVYCGKACRFISFSKGYSKHCFSKECSVKSKGEGC